MDTCAERGFTSNDECLASLMTALEEAAASGLLAERLKYWSDYYDVPFEDINLGINNISTTPRGNGPAVTADSLMTTVRGTEETM